MNFYELKAFLTLSENLHFAKTADSINISPSALSRIISRLEEENGTELLDRTNRKVVLTKNGRIFADFAKETLERQKIMQEKFKGEKGTVSGTLKVYASVTACYTILPLFLSKLAAEFPAIQLAVETGDPAGAIPAIKEGRAALAVAAIPEDETFVFANNQHEKNAFDFCGKQKWRFYKSCRFASRHNFFNTANFTKNWFGTPPL